MAEQANIRAKVREALQDPEPTIRQFLTALYDANDYVTYDELKRNARLGRRNVAAAKSMITKRLAKVPGPILYAKDLFHLNDNKDHRLRPYLWTVVGEILGKKQKIRVTGMKVTISSVSRTSVDHGSIINFEISGLTNSGTTIPASVIVRDRSGNTRQAVEQGCDILRARLIELARSAESLKENLSQWD